MLLTGSFQRTLDDKQRLALPKQIRDALEIPTRSHLYITPGTERSLGLYTQEQLEAVGEQLERQSLGSHDVRAFSRLFYAQAQRLDVDRQGRIRLPSELVTLASLEGEIMLIGVRDHLEIWDLAGWHRFVETSQANFDQLAEKAFGRSAASTS
jgi:MraZ protein